MRSWSGLALLAAVACSNAWADATLVQTVKSGQRDAALAMIKSKVDVNATSADGTTALHWAVHQGDVELAQRLIKAGAKVGVANNYGASPMSEAAVTGDAALLKLLLKAGADVDSPNPEGQTALMAVARTGKLDAAKLLLDRGADVNATENWGGQTALMWATAQKHPDMVKLLLDNGANVDQRATARDWERRVTAEPRIKELFTGGFTALLYAARDGCLECAKNLIAAGADINKPDPDGATPLVVALLSFRHDTAAWLVSAGADVNRWDWWGRTPLYAAADVNIIPQGARRDLPPLDKTTGLDVARMLLEHGANPNLQLKLVPPPRNIVFDRGGDDRALTTGATPLLRAGYGGDLAMIKLLLEHGALVELPNMNGLTPLLAAAGPAGSRGRNKTQDDVTAAITLLLAAGADINARGRGGETAVHTSARLNWGNVVRFLASNGAKLDATDRRGLTPLDYASGKADSESLGNRDVVGVLPEMVALLTELMEAQKTDKLSAK